VQKQLWHIPSNASGLEEVVMLLMVCAGWVYVMWTMLLWTCGHWRQVTCVLTASQVLVVSVGQDRWRTNWHWRRYRRLLLFL